MKPLSKRVMFRGAIPRGDGGAGLKIETEKLYKKFQGFDKKERMVLEDISFTIDPGDFIIILGESGCGKTTLLNIIAGFERPTAGRITADGEEITTVHPSRSMLFQQPALIPWLSVKENVAYGCRIRGDTHLLEYRINQFLEIMGLSGFGGMKPDALSLGMAHRVCLARSLVGHPEVLLLDEPFAALDTFTQAHIQEEMVNLWLSEKFTAVFVTHDIDEAVYFGSKIVLLSGSPATIKEIYEINEPHPRDKEGRTFKNIRRDIMDKFKDSYMARRMVVE